MSNAHKTAIKRKKPSKPMLRLATDGRIVGRALDYGSGRPIYPFTEGPGFDANYYGMYSYDSHYQPNRPTGKFDTITCNYVLNVIESDEEKISVLTDIRALLKKRGFAYITVRNDTRALKGKTSTGTYQCLVTLSLPVVYKCSGFVTYLLDKNSSILLQSYECED